jgi:hypothetical protein
VHCDLNLKDAPGSNKNRVATPLEKLESHGKINEAGKSEQVMK